jgi:hypothetical protein
MSQLTAVDTGVYLLKVDDPKNVQKLLELGAGGDVHRLALDFALAGGVRWKNKHRV